MRCSSWSWSWSWLRSLDWSCSKRPKGSDDATAVAAVAEIATAEVATAAAVGATTLLSLLFSKHMRSTSPPVIVGIGDDDNDGGGSGEDEDGGSGDEEDAVDDGRLTCAFVEDTAFFVDAFADLRCCCCCFWCF